jgi:hypothetical protein
MLAPCWQVRFAVGSKLVSMQAAARQIEECRLGRGFAVESARPELQQHRVRLQWRKACGYNSAIAWATKALLKSSLEWELCLPDGVASAKRVPAVGPAALPPGDATSQGVGRQGG